MKKGISREFGEALFEQIKGFGDYGFPESHAASFALLVYVSAWQKAHFPAHFACALLNSQPMGFYSPSSIVRDAQQHGVRVLDIDVTKSNWDASLEGEPGARELRLGFRLVKGLSEAAGQRIVEARGERQFDDLEDVRRRVRLPKDDLDALAEAGAFESLVRGRRQALWSARAPRVAGLFENARFDERKVTLPELSEVGELVLDYRRKGLSVDDHPLRHLRTSLDARSVTTAAKLRHTEHGELVNVAGVVLCRQQPGTASGIVFITLEDETGVLNLILFRKIFEQYRLPARHSSILFAHGVVERQTRVPGSNEGAGAEGEPVIHVVARSLERLNAPTLELPNMSRDFH